MKVLHRNDDGEWVEEECRLIIDGEEYDSFAEYWLLSQRTVNVNGLDS